MRCAIHSDFLIIMLKYLHMDKQTFSGRNVVVWVLILISVLLITLGIVNLRDKKWQEGSVESSQEEAGWIKYTSVDFNFSISFPHDWKIYEDLENDLEPKINIYKPAYTTKPPLTHFSPETNISIFPKGLATEGVIGETRDSKIGSTILSAEKIEKATDFLLADGKVWANFIVFSEPPQSWKPWGFIWVNTAIRDLTYKCQSGTYEKPIEECDPFTGDVLKRVGKIDGTTRDLQMKILSTFKFEK